MTIKILIINGPNLNLLGQREETIYGTQTLLDLEKNLGEKVKNSDVELRFFQSNHEGILIDKIQEAKSGKMDYIIINPGAYTHTSIALRDALIAVNIPFIEVHISNIFAREEFRRHSYFSDKAKGVIAGMGLKGYELALEFLMRK